MTNMNKCSMPILHNAEISANGATIKTDWFKVQRSPFKQDAFQIIIHVLEYNKSNVSQFFTIQHSTNEYPDGFTAVSKFLMEVIPSTYNVPAFVCDVAGFLYFTKKNICVTFHSRMEGYASIKLIFDPYYQWSVNGKVFV